MFRDKIVSVFLFILISLYSQQVTAKDPECPDHIKQEFRKYKNHRQLFSIAMKESSFNPNARNGSCVGLMQINQPIWYKELIEQDIIKSKKDLKNFKYNIKAADYILRLYNYDYKKYKNGPYHKNKKHRSKIQYVRR